MMIQHSGKFNTTFIKSYNFMKNPIIFYPLKIAWKIANGT